MAKATPEHECPDCDETFSGPACPQCGWSPPTERAAAKKPAAADRRCTWETLGGRCAMPGTIGTKSLLCTWHSYARDDRRLADDCDELDRWIKHLRDQRVCALWTHYPVAAVRAALRGAALDAEPTACASARCLYAA